MKPATTKSQDIPIKLVGGDRYGRYPKISDEQSINMMQSDGWLVSYAGYRMVAQVEPLGQGRAIYTSDPWGHMIAVIGNTVYQVPRPAAGTYQLFPTTLFSLRTFAGDVFIDENNSAQIAICDGADIWIYNWKTGVTTQCVLPVDPATGETIVPGYITFQDERFLTVNKESASWFLSAPGDGTNWTTVFAGGPSTTTIQTKPTNAVAVLRAPGRGTLLYVFGANVTELWNDVGAQLFPYQRNNSISIDYGCLSPTSIAAMDDTVCWLGINEKSGPVIMASQGGDITHISNDGIDYQIQRLAHPEQSYGFFFKQDGHMFYHLSFTHPDDNVTYIYDFMTKSFFTGTDEEGNYFIAQRVAFFNDSYYFVSSNDGDIYQMSTDLTTYNYNVPDEEYNPELDKEIPRIRITGPIRLPDARRYKSIGLALTIEQGNDPYYQGSLLQYITSEGGAVITTEAQEGFLGTFLQTERVVNPYVPRIDLSVSTDGAQSFGSNVSYPLQPLGRRRNRVTFWQLGSMNDFTLRFQFWSKARVAVMDGIMSIQQ